MPTFLEQKGRGYIPVADDEGIDHVAELSEGLFQFFVVDIEGQTPHVDLVAGLLLLTAATKATAAPAPAAL